MSLVQRLLFRLRIHHDPHALMRRVGWSLQGARFGRGTSVPSLFITWPHQVAIGASCILEPDIYFKYDGIWQPGPSIVVEDRVFIGRGCEFNIRNHIQIGRESLIASGCKFIDHDHAMTLDQGPMNLQPCPDAPIVLEEDVWLGVNVVVLKGVTIGKGAVVGAGAIVTKSIPACEIWAGVPARKVGTRSARESRDKVEVSEEHMAA